MAVEFMAGEYNDTGEGTNNSFSVTVPEDADICIVNCVGHKSGYSGALLAQLSWDDGSSNDFTSIGSATAAGDTAQEMLYMKSDDGDWPGSGSKTLYWEVESSLTYGALISVCFFKNVDISGDPIVGTDTYSDLGASWTSSIAGETGDDMGVMGVFSVTGDVDVDIDGQTEVAQTGGFNNGWIAVAYELGEGELSFSNSPSATAVAFVLLAAAAGGLEMEHAMHHYTKNLGA